MRSTFVVAILLLFVFSASSQTKNIKDLENKRKATMKEIENTNRLLKESKQSTVNLLNRINLLTEQIKARQTLISLLNQEMEAVGFQEKETEKEIEQLELNLKEEQKSYSKAIESIVLKKQSTNRLIFLLSGKSLGESMRRMQYLRDYSNWRSKQITDIRHKQQILSEKKQELSKSKADKLALLNNRQQEQQSLKKEEDLLKKEVEEANLKQKELQGILENKQKQANNLNTQIERLIAEEVARQEREAKRLAEEQARREREKREREERAKKEQAQRELERKDKAQKELSRKEQAKREAELKAKESKRAKERTTKPLNENKAEVTKAEKPVMTKENFDLSSNFASNKGRLPMPVTGSYSIVGRFGTHRHDQWNVTTNSSGIDIKAQSGAQARAIFGGEVSRVVAFPGYNNCVIVRHGGYYTFYGNIQHVSVKQGQKVTAGQTLGNIYSDPDSGGSQLHFQLWQGTTKLNPEPWLQK